MTSAADLSHDAESALGFDIPDETAEGISNLTNALRYINQWQSAISSTVFGSLSGGTASSVTVGRVNTAKTAVLNASTAWSNASDYEEVFEAPNAKALQSAYKNAQDRYSEAYMALGSDIGANGQPEIGDAVDAIESIPGKLASEVGNTITETILNLLKSLWPVLLIVVLIVVGYVFRKTLFSKAR